MRDYSSVSVALLYFASHALVLPGRKVSKQNLLSIQYHYLSLTSNGALKPLGSTVKSPRIVHHQYTDQPQRLRSQPYNASINSKAVDGSSLSQSFGFMYMFRMMPLSTNRLAGTGTSNESSLFSATQESASPA
jgi:hypothetical protein